MRFTISHVFNTDIDTFWDKVFYDDEYNRRLFLEGLGFKSFEQLSLEELPDGKKRRKIRTEPTAEAPAAVRKLIGDSLAYTEEGTFDPKTRRIQYSVVPSKLADKIITNGEFWVEARGDKKCERFTVVDLNVKIMLVGGAVEGFVEKTTRDNYDKAAAFTNKWLAEKGYDK